MSPKMLLNDWKIDNSAGRPILTYKGCSVIEAEDAEFVLSTLEAALSAAEPQTAPSVAVKAKKPKLPPISSELYEHYPSMSAQTHAAAVKDYARVAVASALSAQVQEAATPKRKHTFSLSDYEIRMMSEGTMIIGGAQMEMAKEIIFLRSLLPAAPAKQEGCRHDLDQLEIRLQELIAEKPRWALQAEIDDHTRMWFVSELISHASGRIPLLEIEALVSRHIPAAKGGEA